MSRRASFGARLQRDAKLPRTPFITSVAQAVETNAQVECTLAIPSPPNGEVIDFAAVNVKLVSGNDETIIPNVATAADCGADEGWYYDDVNAPTEVVLCPASCDHAQLLAGPGQSGAVEVLFGCETIAK